MRFSLELPTQRVTDPGEFVTADAITETTQAAAAAGFSAVNVTDHPAPDTKWLDNGGHHALDPFVALSFAAAADPDIRLQTNIYVAAYRNPFLGAKLVHSLDVLSGGRLILGVAAGYLRPEFAALGVDFAQRSDLLDDALEVLDALSTGADVTREGTGYRARGVRFRPLRPTGRPPVWVGGNSRKAMARAARYEGWAPFHTAGIATATRTAAIETIEDLTSSVAEVRRLAVEASGDKDREFDVCWSGTFFGSGSASIDEQCSRISTLRSSGVTWAVVSVPGTSRGECLEQIASFGREVISATAGV